MTRMSASSPTLEAPMTSAVHHPARRALAGLLLVVASFVILLGIITAEALYPATYTTHENEISDLGATRPPDSIVLQPSSYIFNGSMMFSGAAILAAGVLGYLWRRRRAYAWLMVAGVAIVGVGVFPGNRPPWHPIFALLTFSSGGIAAIAVGRTFASPFRQVSTVLGAITLTALAFGLLGAQTGLFAEMGDGGVERWIAYPVTLWFAAAGGYLMHEEPEAPVDS